MIGFILRNWRVVAALAALVAAFVGGWQAGSQYQTSRYQRAELARAAETAALAADINRAEARRLAAEAEADAILKGVQDDARTDPDGDLPALGVRDAQRLNAIR
jgi:hypothetical protein